MHGTRLRGSQRGPRGALALVVVTLLIPPAEVLIARVTSPALASLTLGTGPCMQQVGGTPPSAFVVEEGADCIIVFTVADGASWTVPTGITNVDIAAVGGGGAGGTAWQDTAAGGGGGGEVKIATGYDVSGVSTLSITLGAGGVPAPIGVTGDFAPGGDGGPTVVTGGAGVSAQGGSGGARGRLSGVSGPGPGEPSSAGYTGAGGAVHDAAWTVGSTGTGGAAFKGGNARIDNSTADGQSGGGGGGADGAGGNGTAARGGAGGREKTIAFLSGVTGVEADYGGGGGGGKRTAAVSGGGAPGAGGGAGGAQSSAGNGIDGRGGGGGGASGGGESRAGGQGGSGTVIIRYTRASQPALTVTAGFGELNEGSSVTLATTGGAGSGAVSYQVAAGSCSVAGAVLTANAGTGSCTVNATKAADASHTAQTGSVTINLLAALPVAAPDASEAAVRVAAELSMANGVAGSSGAVRVRDGVVVPATSTVVGPVGPRGGVVIEGDGIRVTVASELGADASTGVRSLPGGSLTVTVEAALVPLAVIEVWVRSQPRLVAAVRVPADHAAGRPLGLSVPLGAPLDGGAPVEDGAHTVELRMSTADGYEVIATGLTIIGARPTAVPAGGGPLPIGRFVPLLVSGLAVALLAGRTDDRAKRVARAGGRG